MLSYQHWPVQKLNVPQRVSAGSALVRSDQTGVPVATSSLRKTRLNWPPAFVWPSETYIRVLPLGSVVTAIHGSVVVIAEFSEGLICVHVAPPSFERQTPRAYEDE